MIQTENTAIVLRYVNYRDNDRMVTLLSPSRGVSTRLSAAAGNPGPITSTQANSLPWATT